MRGTRAALLLCVALVGTLLAGCVNVPTSGEVQPVEASGRAQDPRIEIHVDPPQPGASPRIIVSGFLQAMADYQPNYEVAREYLTEEVRDTWRPESGVQVVANNYVPTITEDSAAFEAPLVGVLGADDAYRSASGEQVNHDFQLRRNADGQWRISNPPEGLLMTQYDFEQFYRLVNLYFFEPGFTALVPDPIYVPRSNLSATTLVQRMLRGPTDWLRPAVISAYPERATTISVPVDASGVAEISVSDAVAGLSDQQRTALAAQTVWTLRQLAGVRGVRFLLNGSPYVIRGAVDQVVAIDSHATYGPVSTLTSTQLFVATDAGLARLDDGADQPTPALVEGPLGRIGPIDSMGISLSGDQAAVVTGGGTQLLAGMLGNSEPTVVLADVEGLQRPQYTRYDELLVLGRDDGSPVLWHVTGDVVQTVTVELPEGARIEELRIAPDGVRAAVIISNAAGDRSLGLMRLSRAGGPKLSGFRPVGLPLPQGTALSALVDVVWSEPTTLVVLGAETTDSQLRPYLLNQDGTSLTAIGTSDDWQARRLAASQRRGSSSVEPVAEKLTLLGERGRVWRYEDNYSWAPIAEGIRAVTYPG
ncbi:LpqB family beta-propeller domain-containing protein [Propionibacteriaceae bacterium Y2011]|uniref:LpqB family beta-propeller domain-containing protein n=1 Tax=Microlunatus sp. Y2014 TaxID=3418488 RepID=UPI003B477C3E